MFDANNTLQTEGSGKPYTANGTVLGNSNALEEKTLFRHRLHVISDTIYANEVDQTEEPHNTYKYDTLLCLKINQFYLLPDGV